MQKRGRQWPSPFFRGGPAGRQSALVRRTRMMSLRSRLLAARWMPACRSLAWSVLGALVAAPALAADAGVTYKCPGAIYSNTITPKEAKDRGCSVLDNPPISV